MNIIKKVPVPLAGVMLGTAALGNLLQSYSEMLRGVCGIVAAVFLILILLKLIMYPQMIMEDMKNPIMAAVAATFPMGIMLLTVYLKPFYPAPAMIIWYIAIILHVLLMVYYTMKFMFKFNIMHIHASVYIVYVGIAVTGVTAPAFSALTLGMISFYFALVCFVILTFIVISRYLKHRDIPEPALPLFCIIAAPANLCVVSYMASSPEKSALVIIALSTVGFVLYITGLIRLVGFLKLKFYPSYASFAFPFVIGAIALKQTNAFLLASGQAPGFLATIVLIQTIIAVILVVYTWIRYCMFLLK
jgi:exfoliative toxin A/B